MKVLIPFLFALNVLAQENPYQIGPVWGRKSFTIENRDEVPSVVREQARSVAKFLGGTAFYLGKFDGAHIMATNYHVLPNALNCYSFAFSEFTLESLHFSCKKFILSLPEVELSLYEIKVREENEPSLKSKGIPLTKNSRPREIFGLGYGIQGNPHPTRKALMLTNDRHCKIFGKRPKLMNDPDQVNPVEYQVWSWAVGCDISHGDSGAPAFNEKGELAGLFWTGALPKPVEIKDEGYLDDLFRRPDERIWNELSYMVPADKILKTLRGFLKANPAHSYFEAIKAVVEQRPD